MQGTLGVQYWLKGNINLNFMKIKSSIALDSAH